MGKNTFINTITNIPGKQFLITTSIDLALFVLVYIGVMLWALGIKWKASPLQSLNIDTIAYQKPSELSATLGNMKGFLIFLVIIIIIFFLYVLISLCLTKGSIYRLILNKKISKKYLVRFLKWGSLWYLGFIIILLGFMTLIRNHPLAPIFLFVGFLVLLHFTVIFQTMLALDQKHIFKDTIKVSIKNVWYLGFIIILLGFMTLIRNHPLAPIFLFVGFLVLIHRFIIPWLITILLFILLSFVSRILQYMPPAPGTIIASLFLLIYFNVIRYYLTAVAKKELH